MQESAPNQYAAPKAVVADVEMQAGPMATLKFFSLEGRIGRLRYLAWTAGAQLICTFVVILLAAALRSPTSVSGLSTLLGIVVWIFAVLCSIRRCHDIGISGWWTLTCVIPIIALAWIFWPGSRGENRFGPPPPPNGTGVRVLGLVLPIVAFVGILAAVAIPQYKAYTDRARAAAAAQQPRN